MCPVKNIPLDTLNVGATFSVSTSRTRAIQVGAAGSPGPSIMRLGDLEVRIVEHDKTNYIVRTHEGALEFYLNGRLAGVLNASGEFWIRGKGKEIKTTAQLEHAKVLTPDGGLEFDPNNGPAWAFGVTDGSKAVAVGRLQYDGTLLMYRFAEGRFPLTAAASPSFGSDYVIDVSGVTHITQNGTQTLARLDPEIFEKAGTAVAFDSGWTLPTVASEQADAGVAWVSDDNALLDDGNVASAATSGSQLTKTMHLLSYAFAIPNKTLLGLDGIEVRVSRSHAGNQNKVFDEIIQMVLGGTATGDNKADTVTGWPLSSADAFTTYGGPTDRWGLSAQQLRAALLAADFGVAIKAENTLAFGGDTIRLQNAQIRLYGHSFEALHNAKMNLRRIRERAFS